MFEATSVSALAAAVDRARGDGSAIQAPPLIPAARTGPMPASFAQQRLWFLAQLEPDSTAYNMSFVLELSGAVDIGALSAAVAELCRRHEVLRLTIDAVEGKPVARIHPAGSEARPVIDVIDASNDDVTKRIRAIEAEPFDITTSMVRAAVLRAGADHHFFVMAMHHIVTDGWSFQIVKRELSQLYMAFASGRPSPVGLTRTT